MVLFIVALVLGGVLTPLSTRLEQANRKQAEDVLKEIKSSLLGFALVNGHLPCPDCPANGATAYCTATNSNDGIEDGLDTGFASTTRGNFAYCAAVVGNVPWATLGVSEFDPWGHHYVYGVDQTFADDPDGTGCGTATAGVSFELCSTGNINIQDINGNPIASQVPALIMSFGANGRDYGGIEPTSTAEKENWWTSINGTFISNEYVSDQFDDIVDWITDPELMYRMVTAEQLP